MSVSKDLEIAMSTFKEDSDNEDYSARSGTKSSRSVTFSDKDSSSASASLGASLGRSGKRKTIFDLPDNIPNLQGRKTMNRGSMRRQSSLVIPSMEEFLEKEEESEGISEERLKHAFLNFVEPGTFDLAIQNLLELLRYVGHPVISSTGEAVEDLVREITTYEYLDYDEYISFMERYAEYEKEHFHEVFHNYDDDGSGELDLRELRQLLKEVGIMTLSGMFSEAIEVVDVDNNGQLDFEEFLKFLKIYQRNEGFTSEEVEDICESIDQLRDSEFVPPERGPGIPVELLADILIRFFGVHTTDDANDLQQKLIDRHVLHNPHANPSFMLSVTDVLLCGRQLREKYYHDLKNPPKEEAVPGGSSTRVSLQVLNRASVVEFEKYDEDGDRKISQPELRRALKKMEYEPLSEVLDEILDEVLPEEEEEENPDRVLEFDEFFDFLLVYRQREGFLKEEVQEYKDIFHNYDEDNSGDVSTLELGDIFRYIGYSLTVDELKRYILLVDEDRTNELNFREFLRLMHLHRNNVIRRIRDAFNMAMDIRLEIVNRSGALKALQDLGHTDLPKESISEIPDECEFEDFVHLADKFHKEKVLRERKKAGFSETELDYILELFNRFDTDGGGSLDCKELQGVFTAFGWVPKDREEAEEIFGRLDLARKLAREAGVEDTTELGSTEINAWEFVQLARMIRKQQETAEERAMTKLATELRFTMPEVNEFREVFTYWLKDGKDSDESESEEEDGTKKEGALSRDIVRHLIRRMGVRFTTESKDLLDKQLEVVGKGSLEIDFQAFLHLMRWLLDTDFGGLSSKLAGQYGSSETNKRGSIREGGAGKRGSLRG